MADFCTCGAQLPPDARFCHKCGKPQYDYPSVQEEEHPAPAAVMPPAVQAPPEISFHNRLAVRIGFLAALTAVLVSQIPLPFPLLRLLVAFVAAGFLAVFLYIRRTGQILSVRSGARMGWITGIFAFTLFSVLFTIAMIGIANQGGLAKFLRTQLPANDATKPLMDALADPATLAGFIVLILITLFIMLTALPMIGGALGAKVFEKNDA